MSNSATQEDRRTAAGITVTLSSQLMAASLAALGFVVVAWTYIADKREINSRFVAFCVGSFVAFIVSIFVGGKGVTTVRDEGFKGEWQPATARKMFNFQAGFCLLALLFFVCSVGVTRPKNEDTSARLIQLEQKVRVLEGAIRSKLTP